MNLLKQIIALLLLLSLFTAACSDSTPPSTPAVVPTTDAIQPEPTRSNILPATNTPVAPTGSSTPDIDGDLEAIDILLQGIDNDMCTAIPAGKN